jgi:hypothetical protein
VAERPEILTVVVHAPGGAGKDATGGEFEEDGVDGAILIIFRVAGQTLHQMASAEGEKEVLLVDVVEREHRAAGEEELIRLRLKAEFFKWDAQRRVRIASGKDGVCGEEKKTAQ